MYVKLHELDINKDVTWDDFEPVKEQKSYMQLKM